jgi:hypothetical protein
MRGMKVRSAQVAGIANYDADQCHALVVGINTYKHWSNLRSAANDAEAVAKLLKTQYGYKDVTLLLNEQATRRNILSALDKYTRLTEQDSLLIYYAGHGWMDDYQNGFWVPYEAPRDSKFDYVANSRIVNDYFKKYRVRHLLVVADSCFSGALMRGVSQTRGSKWKLPAGFRKPSRWVLTSGDLAPVPDDAGGGHSPFATRFLQFMKYSDEPAFGIHDLYVYVRKNLKTDPLCEPINTAMHMPGGEFVFCRLDEPLQGGSLGGMLKSATPAHSIRSTPSVTIPTTPATTIQHGALVITSPVQGVVSIDGQGAYSITPTQNLRWGKLPVGTHNIAVVAGDDRWEERVLVIQNQTVTVAAKLSDRHAQLVEAAAKREARAREAELDRYREEDALRQQRLVELELEQKQQAELTRLQLDDARARRSLEVKLEREAAERENEGKKKKVRRPKVH